MRLASFTRADLNEAVMLGAVERERPKMMTVVAIMPGLVPIPWSTGTGSEVMQRIAVPDDRRSRRPC
jgi:copper/silver efflux system protein